MPSMGLIGCLAFVAICGGQASPAGDPASRYLEGELRHSLWYVSQDQIPKLPENPFADTPSKVQALTHWIDEIDESVADRSTVLAQLDELLKRCPELRIPFVDQTLARLRLTVTTRYQGSDEIEKLIDRLCESRRDGSTPRFNTPENAKPDPLIELSSRGSAAIPKLIEHADDERLTRCIWRGPMMAIPRFVTVGEACSNLAEQFSSGKTQWRNPSERKADLINWWSTASKEPDRKLCFECLTVKEDSVPEASIYWAGRSFPDVLLQAYNEIVKSNRKSQTSGLLDAMLRTSVDRRLIVEAVKRGAGSNVEDVALAALWCLQKLDKTAFENGLAAEFERLPTAAASPAWLSSEASFAQLAGCSNSPTVWAALTHATKRAGIDLRLELIDKAQFASLKEGLNLMRLKYWASFFSDKSSAKPKTDVPSPELDEHFLLASRRADHLAMILAARELLKARDLKVGQPANDQTPETRWETFRLKLLAEIQVQSHRAQQL